MKNSKNKNVKYILNKKNKIIIIEIILLLILFIVNELDINNNKKENFNNINKNISLNIINNNKTLINMKVCLCTLAKNENKYIKEFVEHYKKYGVDKIYLYDNNDINGEKLEDVIDEYVKNGFVEILNWRGQKQALYKIMNNCYQTNYNNYDYLLFYEIDEYIHLYNYTNIKPFLSMQTFNNCEIIYLNLICHTDNNKLYYEDKPLAERFPEKVSPNKIGGKYLEIKFILKGHIPNLIINNVHRGNTKNKNCNSFGHSNKYNVIYATEPDYKYYYIDHYYSKSTEEFIYKINHKASPIYNSIDFLYERIKKYFSENEITYQKIKMIENGTRLNLSKYKLKLIKNMNNNSNITL